MIEAGAEDVSIINSLVWVIDTGRVETVKAVLARGANVDVDTYCGTPIQNAAKKGYIEIVDLLIEAGANPHCKDGEGLSAYKWAVKNEFSQVLAVLKEAGFDHVVVTLEEQLINAAKQGNITLVK